MHVSNTISQKVNCFVSDWCQLWIRAAIICAVHACRRLLKRLLLSNYKYARLYTYSMFYTSSSGGYFPFLSRLTARLWPWLVFTTVGIVLAPIVASPSYAWWFTPVTSGRAVTPVHQQGLVIAPITKALVPQFILQPLSQTVTETPPTLTAASSSTPTPTAKPRVTVTPHASTTGTPAHVSAPASSMAVKILSLVNQQRAAHGLSALTLNSALTASAQTYAERMASEHFFSHVAPDGTTFKQRNEAAGYTNWTWMGENIAYGQTSAEMVMSDWMNSQGHRENILNIHAKELGVGYAGAGTRYWVQEFGSQ